MLIHIPDDPEAAAEARAAIVADGRLTFAAIGFLLVILDHAPEWRVGVGTISEWARDRRGEHGEDVNDVRILLLELLNNGYAIFTSRPGDDGSTIHETEVFAVPQTTSTASEKRQVVYLIGAPEGRIAKIGTTSNLRTRLRVLQTGSPVRLEVLASCPGGRRLESWLHEVFGAHRLEGEWFDFRHWDPVLTFQKTVEQARMMGVE